MNGAISTRSSAARQLDRSPRARIHLPQQRRERSRSTSGPSSAERRSRSSIRKLIAAKIKVQYNGQPDVKRFQLSC